MLFPPSQKSQFPSTAVSNLTGLFRRIRKRIMKTNPSRLTKILWPTRSSLKLVPCHVPSHSFPLTHPFCLDHNSASHRCKFTLVNGARERFDPSNNHTVLLKPSDLNQVGLISGDWVRVIIVRVGHTLTVSEAIICGVDTRTRRLVKVAAHQGVPPKRCVSLPVEDADSV